MNRPVCFLATTCSLVVLATLTGTIALAQTNPVPFVNQPLSPTSVFAGHGTSPLKVIGAGFVPGSVVNGMGLREPRLWFPANYRLRSARLMWPTHRPRRLQW